MRYVIYIAAAAVIGLLIGFVVISIGWLKKSVLRSIRSKTLGLMAAYDELIEEKSIQLAELEYRKQELENEINAVTRKSNLPGVTARAAVPDGSVSELAERAGNAVYRDNAVGSVYHVLRKNFAYDAAAIIPVLGEKGAVKEGPATRLLAELQYDTIYGLSTLQPEEQLAILSEAMGEDAKCLLAEYTRKSGEFNVLGFYDHLRTLANAEPKPVRLHMSADSWDGELNKEGVEIVLDEDICEGFQVEEGQILYDYCIKARE